MLGSTWLRAAGVQGFQEAQGLAQIYQHSHFPGPDVFPDTENSPRDLPEVCVVFTPACQ